MAVESLQDYLRRRYDPHLGFHLFNAKFPVEDVMLCVAPLIHILATTRFRWVKNDDMEDPKARAFCDLLHLLGVKYKNRMYATDKQFHFDCWWTVYRAFNKELRFNKPEELNRDDLEHSRMPHPQDFDRLNWMDRVKEDIRAMVLEQVRFSEAEFGVCEYALRALLDNRRPNFTVIARDYGLSHADFYVDYVKVLIRKSLYDIRDNPATYDSLLKELVPNATVKDTSLMDDAFLMDEDA
jgi:hypothetical protein